MFDWQITMAHDGLQDQGCKNRLSITALRSRWCVYF